MSSSSFAWNSTAIPFSARLRASFEEAYTIFGCNCQHTPIILDLNDTNLDASIIWGPRNEGNLASADSISSVFPLELGTKLPRTLAARQLIIKVIDSVSRALANLSLFHMSTTTRKPGVCVKCTVLLLDCALSNFSRKASQSLSSLVSSITISL